MAPSGEKSKKVDLSGLGNDVTNVYAKFRNFNLRHFSKTATTRTTTSVVAIRDPSGSKKHLHWQKTETK